MTVLLKKVITAATRNPQWFKVQEFSKIVPKRIHSYARSVPTAQQS